MRSERMLNTLTRSFSSFAEAAKSSSPVLWYRATACKLVLADSPPPRQGRTANQARHQLVPDQGLNIFRNDEVLLRFRQHEGQVGQRTSQMGTAACRQARAEYVRHVP